MNAKRIAAVLKDYELCHIDIGGYTPPSDGPFSESDDAPYGLLVLSFLADDLPEVCVGIEFGVKHEQGYFMRSEFDREGWSKATMDPLSSDVIAINFDEA
jgi:hypothetical protein